MQRMSAREAKNGFGLLIDTARAAPVAIEKHGRPVVVVVSVEEYQRLVSGCGEGEHDRIQIITAGQVYSPTHSFGEHLVHAIGARDGGKRERIDARERALAGAPQLLQLIECGKRVRRAVFRAALRTLFIYPLAE